MFPKANNKKITGNYSIHLTHSGLFLGPFMNIGQKILKLVHYFLTTLKISLCICPFKSPLVIYHPGSDY
jgi:hypothetical protein